MSESVHHVSVQGPPTEYGRSCPLMEITVWSSALPVIWENFVHNMRTRYDSPLFAKWLSVEKRPLTRGEVMEVIESVDATKFSDALLGEG